MDIIVELKPPSFLYEVSQPEYPLWVLVKWGFASFLLGPMRGKKAFPFFRD